MIGFAARTLYWTRLKSCHN